MLRQNLAQAYGAIAVDIQEPDKASRPNRALLIRVLCRCHARRKQSGEHRQSDHPKHQGLSSSTNHTVS